jgi:hypothetical protein
MLEALLDWKKTCAYARCSEESRATLKKRTAEMVRKVRGNGWRDKWFRANEGSREMGGTVPLGWHLFEAHMGGCRKAERNSQQKTAYKDDLFQRLEKADRPEDACWASVFGYFRSAVKDIVQKEVTAITFPEARSERGRYVPYDENDKNSASSARTQGEVAELEKIAVLDDVLDGMDILEVQHDKDLEARLSDEFVDDAFGELSSRGKLIVYFRLHDVTLNRLPLGNPAVQRAAGTHRFQALYDDVRTLREKLFTLAKSRLKTDSMINSDIHPYECMLLAKMLLIAMLPKINAWAEAENLPRPPFLAGNE